MEEWDYEKNEELGLTPDNVGYGSKKKVYWVLPYDDPNTGKHFDFEWEAIIKNRINGIGCPYLTGNAVWSGFNDLETTHPELVAEWHPTKNNIKPTELSAGSNQKVWWYLPYNDPTTGKHFGFEWESTIYDRTKGCGCPYLSGHAVWQGFNDLLSQRPALATQWHPIKNILKPVEVTISSNQKVWWLLPYDDPKTGKHFDFEWESTIYDRVNGADCPYLTGNAVWQGFNDLETTHPELAAEWHPTKNGNLLPTKISSGSGQKVWWLLPYDDPKTGNHYDFEWQATINDRTRGRGCPYLSGHAVWQGFNDLSTIYPELAVEWHPTKNGDLKPENFTKGSGQNIWWKCFVCNHEWKARIADRTKGCGCPNCNDKGTSLPELAIYYYFSKVYQDTKHRCTDFGFELDVYIPSINTAIEYDGSYWHKNKLKQDNKKDQFCKDNNIRLIRLRGNGLKATSLAETIYIKENSYKMISNSIKELFVYLNISHNFNIDINTDFKNIINTHLLKEKENSLETTHPELAAEWHPTKNGNLLPTKISSGSGQKVWWLLPYDDPKTGKHFNFEWQATVASRATGIGCPYLTGNAVWSGFNDLETTHPELAAEWHPTKNGNLKPTEVSAGSGQKVWWLLPYDDLNTGKHFDFEWQAIISNRVNGAGCPYLTGNAVWSGFNDLETTHPDLVKEWDFIKNSNLDPKTITYGSSQKVWWKCTVCSYEWAATIGHRTNGRDCPRCSKNAFWTNKEINIIKKYYLSEGIKIKNRLPYRSEKSIMAKAKQLGLKRQRNTDNNNE